MAMGTFGDNRDGRMGRGRALHGSAARHHAEGKKYVWAIDLLVEGGANIEKMRHTNVKTPHDDACRWTDAKP